MLEKDLKGDVAYVTGSASGIGMGVARTLAAHGATVVCVDINEKGLKKNVDAIRKMGGDAYYLKVDLSDSAQIRESMAEVYRQSGKISILINCAALCSFNHIQDCSDEEWDQIMRINIGGFFYCLREVHPYMVKNGGGRIVQFSSSTALSGTCFAGPAYTASKSAVFGLTKYAAGLWGKDNIRVNSICPGLTNTSMTNTDGEVREKNDHEKLIPLGRIANTSDIANVVYFLVSEYSGYMTGTTLHVNGGKYMYGI